MKTKLFYLVLLSTFTLYSQTQIGADIDGEAAGDYSGYRVSLSSDGSIVATGEIYNDGNGSSSGQVRVYQNISSVWTQMGTDINGEVANDRLGQSVSLSSDGSIVAIGASLNDGNGSNSGHVRVYQNISDVWTQIGNDIDGEVADDRSGFGLSLSGNGSIVAIGAFKNDENGSNSGHVRVYENISDVWTQIGTDINGEAEGDELGYSVSLSSDGGIVAIGAPSNEGNGSNSGHVRIYENISSVWTQIGADIDGEGVGDESGTSVSLSSDGNTVAIGAFGNDGNGYDSGHVRIYKNISDVWTQIGADIDGEASSDYSGSCVCLSSDGNMVASGAFGNDENGSDSGHVRVYDLSGLLSTEDNEISKNFSVYPNPLSNYLQLQIATTLEFKKASIYNYFGQLVLQSKKTEIDVSNLSSGVYFLEVETGKGKGIKKFIKK